MSIIQKCAVGDEAYQDVAIMNASSVILFAPNRLTSIFEPIIQDRLESSEFLVNVFIKCEKLPMRRMLHDYLLNSPINADILCSIMLKLIPWTDDYPSNCRDLFHLTGLLLPRCANLSIVLNGLGGTFFVMDNLKCRIENHVIFEVLATKYLIDLDLFRIVL